MENKKYIIALIFIIFAGLFAGAQNKFQISNLKIEHSVNKDGNIDARITFTYKQTEGYVDKVTPRLAVDGNVIRSSYQGGFNGGALRLESNGVLNLRTGMEEMPKDLSTNTLISKLNDGKHTLSVKFEGYMSSYSNKFTTIDSNVATVDFWIGEKGSSTPASNNNSGNPSNTKTSDSSSTEDEIVVLTDEIGSDIVKLFWDPAQAVNRFGEVWIDTITSNNGSSRTKEYIFQQITSYEIPVWEKDKHPNVKQYGDRYMTSSIFNMRYKFVVLKGSVYFDRSNGRVATAPNTLAYIDEFQKGDGAEGDSHWRTIVLQANKYYRGNELHILVKDYFSEPLIFPKAGVKASFEVKTPTATASVRGTEYEVIVLPNGQSEFYLYEGALEVKNSSGSVLLKPGEMISVASKNSPIQFNPFNNGERYNLEWSNIVSKIQASDISDGSSTTKKGTNSLFSNVSAGGTLVNPHKTKAPSTNSNTNTQSCLGQLKVQFITKIGGAPANQQQMMMMQRLNQQNQWEQRWFNTAEENFKKGIMPKELIGTFRPDQSGNPENGKYYSETVTLFRPMQIATVDGNAKGFTLVHAERTNSQHFAPIETARGKTLQCGSYKITVDPLINVEKTWASITLSEAGSTPQPPQNGGGNNPPSNPPPTSKPQSCIEQMQVQFIHKTGAVNDPQGRMIAMKLDDENKRELFWFNQAADNYKRGVLPREMSGTYRRQQNPGPLSREYYSETITLFEPMKITNPTGNSHGFSLLKGTIEFEKFNSNQEAEGVVLPCGSYKVIPSADMPFSAAKFQLLRIQ